MTYRSMALVALLLTACSSDPAATPGSTAVAGLPPGTTLAPDDFVPTMLTLEVDGAPVEIQQRGFVSVADAKNLTVTLGTFRGEKAGTRTRYGVSLVLGSSGSKPIAAADFGRSDAGVVVVGMNWVKELTAATYNAEDTAAMVIAHVGDKVSISYEGTLKRFVGPDAFATSAKVKIAAEGIPTKK